MQTQSKSNTNFTQLKPRIFGLIGITILAFLLIWSLLKDTSPSVYHQILLKERQNKNQAFRINSESPLTEEMKKSFTGLVYFEPDINYQTEAELELSKKPDTLLIPRSDGMGDTLIKLGIIQFDLPAYPDQKFKLTVFQNPYSAPDQIFIPFRDLTSGKETYGGGRYLELKWKPETPVVIDFNRVYHPFCVYNDQYVCVIPSDENRLPVKINAGERLPQEIKSSIR